jgi:hypothetical protein
VPPLLPHIVMVRVIAESQQNGTFILRTSDLRKLRQKIGDEVFDYFCCCFLHADRITSLIAFKYLSQENHGENSVASSRDDFNVCWFLAGVMKELEQDLSKLRAALIKKGSWDLISWEKNLKKWETWGQTKSISLLRNQIAFHVNRRRINEGLNSIPNEDAIIFRFDGERTINSWCEIANEALIRGSQITTEDGNVDLKAIIENLPEYLFIQDAIVDEFLRVLKYHGLNPIQMSMRGSRLKLDS